MPMKYRSGCHRGASGLMKIWRGLRSISPRAPEITWSAPPSPSMAASSTPIPASRARGGVSHSGNIINSHTPRKRGPTIRHKRSSKLASVFTGSSAFADDDELSSHLDLHILEIARLVVDADLGRRDPWGEAA